MKRLLIAILLALSSFYSFAQPDFLHFIDSIDWSMTESDFVKLYADQVKQRKHFYNDYNKTTTDYTIGGFRISDYEIEASINVDSLSRHLVSLSFTIKQDYSKVDYQLLSTKMDIQLISFFGQPDEKKNDLDNTYVKYLDRKWYKDNYNVNVSHMVFSEGQLYTLEIQGVDNSKPDFRVAKWGDSKASVMEKEGKSDLAGIDELYLFNSIIAGMSCQVAYVFTDDNLSMAKYVFKENHTNKNDYIADYRALVKLMSNKYGEPKWNSPEWRNRLYKDSPDDYGFAISIGHLIYSAGWFGDKTDITVYLKGENYKIDFVVQYVSKKYEQMKEKKEQQKDLDLL